jgi:hypothetical protein
MNVFVHPGHTGATDVEAISPELALVDPALARAARALLPEPAGLAIRPPPNARAVVAAASSPRRARDPIRRSSTRILVGVAATTILVLLLFDVRVEVGGRSASAERRTLGTAPTVRTSTPRASARAGATPAAPSAPSTQPTAIARRFAWAPVSGATEYHVEFFRGPERVFARNVEQPELALPASWSHGGEKQSLRPGRYKWYVWPVVSGLRQSRAAVQTTVRIEGS